MCGLVVMLGLGGRRVEAAILNRMAQSIAHRGPDDSGVYVHHPVGFGFRRLSILDLSPTGHQPMSSSDGQLVIVFNGEIYNYIELRDELQAAGYCFRSTSDTEVLLAAYRHWGPGCLDRLNGMWAFVIHDRRRGVLFGARDRFGVKPLFVHRGKDCWLLASEIKAILASGLYHRATNWQVAADFLVHGKLDETPATFYAGIEQVPPGCAFELRLDGSWRQWEYWSLVDHEADPPPDSEEAVAELLDDAVRIRLRSDVPVGVCLSGGIDSTAIICAMARHRQQGDLGQAAPLLAFCYHEPAFDERAFIDDTLAQTGALLRRTSLTPAAMWESLPEVLRFQDEPIHSGAPIAGFHLMKLASTNGVKVVLNGQGADETFAGYASYFQDYWYTLLRTAQVARAWHEIRAYAAGRGTRGRGILFLTALSRLFHHQLRRFSPYRGLARRRRSRYVTRNRWFTPSLIEHLGANDTDYQDPDLNTVLRRSVERTPLPHYLRMEDRNSMAHGVEARLPFMDYRLVSLAFRLPSDRKIDGVWNKALLRNSLRGRIPESVRTRVEKMGFPTSLHIWVTDELAEPLRDILVSRAARERGIYNVSEMLSVLQNNHRIEPADAMRLFHVAEFELWQGLPRA
ncbi:MAG TPA: asparagine synthase (glutamine-hydrolyzing) [Gemmatimonadales bacterium]|jgi:asparagine synthase (glutamine-hydrolysing)|nr:asparagine synthase (glutamine-hydrolyzing) [Gemmatimonadales bacterium]